MSKTIQSVIILSTLLFGQYAQSTEDIHHFQNAWRKIWEEHVFWTRSYLVSNTNALEDSEFVYGRLQKNQADLGESLKPFYGEVAGMRFTQLLLEHVKIGGNLITFLGQHQDLEAIKTMQLWRSNVDDIAVHLNHLNQAFWPLGDVQAILNEHLNKTDDEIKLQISKDWNGSISAYDQVHHHALFVADFFSKGIIKQFPERFTRDHFH